jgi:hypothetical protein
LNILAELLRFGDREFYKDWWNARTVEEVGSLAWYIFIVYLQYFQSFMKFICDLFVFVGCICATAATSIGGCGIWYVFHFHRLNFDDQVV